MLKTFPVDILRQIFEQSLLEEKNLTPYLFGGDREIKIFSFYETLEKNEEVDRYVETYRELTDQQNRTALIGLGTITAPSNPSITNLHNGLIIPLEYTLTMRTTLANRDTMLGTLYNLIDKLKGIKVDIAEFDNGKSMCVGTIGVNYGAPRLKNGDYVGDKPYNELVTVGQFIASQISDLGTNKSIDTTTFSQQEFQYLYFGKYNSDGELKLSVVVKEDGLWKEKEDDGSYPEIIFPPEHNYFVKYQTSISFESVRCDEPYTLNAEDYMTISFGGSATIVSDGIVLGNQLVKVGITKSKIVADPVITFVSAPQYILEPLDLPSGNNINTIVNQLTSNNFKTNSHADAISPAIQYTFVLDKNQTFLNQLFKYARYGNVGVSVNDISPNMIYSINEWWSSWGVVDLVNYSAKIVEDINIENTEGDVLTIGITCQVQGANN